MARVNVKSNTIQAKLVYYGPGLCGKTTNLQWVNRHLGGGQELMSLATEGDRTIFFDFLPIDLGKLRDMDVQFKLYTVPGQVRYNQTRKMVLKNVDGVVFVADSQPQMMDANLESFENLFSNLTELGLDAEQLVIVLQYNKRDLPDVLPEPALDKALNHKKYPTFLASAHTGEGVGETLKEACKLVLRGLATQLMDTGRFKAEKNQTPAAQSAQRIKAVPNQMESGSASQGIAQTAAAARPAFAGSAAAHSVAAQVVQTPVAITMQGGAQSARAEAGPAEALSAAPAAMATIPRPAGEVKEHAARLPVDLRPALDQALAEAKGLVVELKAGLVELRAERARAASSDPLAKLASQLVTKADLESLRSDWPSKADLQALRDRVALLAAKSDLETVGKAASSSASEVARAIATLAALPTKADLQRLGEQMATQQAAELRQAVKNLAEQSPPPAPATGVDVQAALAELVEHVKRAPAATPDHSHAGLATKADLAAFSERLNELPTKADLEKHSARSAEAPLASEVRALANTISELARKTDLEALQNQIRSLAAAIKRSLEQQRAEPGASTKGQAIPVGEPPTKQPEKAKAEQAASAETPATAERAEMPAAAERAEIPAAAERAEIPAAAERAEIPAAAEAPAPQAPADEAPRSAEAAQPRAAEPGPAETPEPQAAEPQAAEPAEPQAAEPAEPQAAEPAEPQAAEPAEPQAAEPAEPQAAEPAEPQAAEPAEPAESAPAGAVDAAETEAAPTEADAPAAAPVPAEAQKPDADEFAGNREHQNAARIARVMMADLYLYNKEQVDAGIANNDFYERNKEALADMRLTYESRVKAEIRSARDYLQLAMEEFIKKKKKQMGLDA